MAEYEKIGEIYRKKPDSSSGCGGLILAVIILFILAKACS
jgi:hypothetical protein